MVKNRMKYLIFGLVISATLGLTACGKTAQTLQAEEKEAAVETVEEPQEVVVEETEEETQEEPEEEPEKEEQEEAAVEEAAVEETTEEEAPADETVAGEMSDDWTDMEFVLDGVNYTLPVSYHELEANGWSINLADYGYENGYIMNSGDKTYGTIDLVNPKFNQKMRCTVGFVNLDSAPQDITDCSIWIFNLATSYAFSLLDNVPSMEIAKGIGMGSTKEEVIAAFGETDDVYDASDKGYYVLKYDMGYMKHLSITVYDEFGVTDIKMDTYE